MHSWKTSKTSTIPLQPYLAGMNTSNSTYIYVHARHVTTPLVCDMICVQGMTDSQSIFIHQKKVVIFVSLHNTPYLSHCSTQPPKISILSIPRRTTTKLKGILERRMRDRSRSAKRLFQYSNKKTAKGKHNAANAWGTLRKEAEGNPLARNIIHQILLPS